MKTFSTLAISEKEISHKKLELFKSMKCPFDAKVVEDYTPSPYEHACISLKKGQVITVLEMKSMGKWYGESQADGRRGLFPFNRVEILHKNQ